MNHFPRPNETSRKCDIFSISKVFEDVNEAVRYCDLLQGGGKGCEGVAEIEASSVRLCNDDINLSLGIVVF